MARNDAALPVLAPEAVGVSNADRAPLLQLDGVTKRFGGISALNGVTFEMQEGEILGLIGPNGTGKTTLFNVIGGHYKPTSGRIHYAGLDITRWPAHRVARHGLIRTFQFDALFDDQSILDNVLVGSQAAHQAGLLPALFGGPRDARKRREARRLAVGALETVGLSTRADEPCAPLSHGQKRLLGIAVALCARPRLLMLDEPLSGLTDDEVRRTVRLCQEIRQSGVSLLIVEHNIEAVLGLCDRIVVLNFGVVLAQGGPDEVRTDARVIEAYLGEDTTGVSRATVDRQCEVTSLPSSASGSEA